MDSRSLLRTLLEAAVKAADPFAATHDALAERLSAREGDGRGWIIAVGKASERMARAALDAAAATGLEVAGGVVAGAESARFDPPIEHIVGDHPVPGARSHRAALRIGALTHAVLPADHVMLLVSGGTSSLVAAPADGVNAAALDALFRTLLGAGEGVDINVMNAVRRRFLQWGGGRLAAALVPARIEQVLLSDVIGDDASVIGSGPAVPDPLYAQDVLDLLDAHGLVDRLDGSLIDYLRDVVRGARGETPKANDAVFDNVDRPVVIGRALLLSAVVGAARSHGADAHVHDEPLAGEAAGRGAELARWLATAAPAGVHCWAGETTVTLSGAHGLGGRCQELALAAAIALESAGDTARPVTLLAAGTDGRDGPTDAAGAIVDAAIPAAVRNRGLVPGELLARHDSHRALDAAGALLRTGHTGTNVADILIALVR